jgi:adenylate kinase
LIYHTKFKPAPADIAGRLTQRSDDTEEKVDSLLPLHRGMFFVQTLSCQVKVRVAAYHQNLKALTDTYKSVLVRINGDRKPDDIYKDVSKSIKGQ